jgi:hypothetical protein
MGNCLLKDIRWKCALYVCMTDFLAAYVISHNSPLAGFEVNNIIVARGVIDEGYKGAKVSIYHSHSCCIIIIYHYVCNTMCFVCIQWRLFIGKIIGELSQCDPLSGTENC